MASLIDLTGQCFGRLTVIERVPKLTRRGAVWRCTCACGKTTVVLGTNLRQGNTRSCGCLKHEMRARIDYALAVDPTRRGPGKPAVDVAGQRFGRLVVVGRVGTKYGRAIWQCHCDCGNITQAAGIHLRNGVVQSCGCLRRGPRPAQRGKQKRYAYAALRALVHELLPLADTPVICPACLSDWREQYRHQHTPDCPITRTRTLLAQVEARDAARQQRLARRQQAASHAASEQKSV